MCSDNIMRERLLGKFGYCMERLGSIDSYIEQHPFLFKSNEKKAKQPLTKHETLSLTLNAVHWSSTGAAES